MTAAPGTDWAVQQIVKVTDGDTLRIIRRRTVPVADGLLADFYDTAPVAVRLINLDTPERGRVGYLDAARDVAAWLAEHDGQVRVVTWPGGGFDRLLGDLYVAWDRGNTLSQHMLRDKGWPPYVRGV